MDGSRVFTGIDKLDAILSGGLVRHQNALLRGPPGAGKTIFGLHFLSAGIDNGETSLFINLGEPSRYVKNTAAHFDLNPDAIHFHDLSPTAAEFDDSETYTLFSSAEVEQPSFVEDLRDTIDDLQPDRVLLDPITEFRYLTADDRQFRKQILSFLDFLKANEATVMLTSQAAETQPDDDLQFLTDTVINLETDIEGRSLHVSKFRGSTFQRGRHSYEINDVGVTVWPKLQPTSQNSDFTHEKLSSGVPELDQLLNGGIETGTVTFLSGPTGTGKTTTGLQFMKEAVTRDVKSVLYSFEESTDTIFERSEAINIPVEDMAEGDELSIVEILPDQYTTDEFTAMVQTAVEDDGAEIVMIDGIQGFKTNLRELGDDPSKTILRLGRYLRSKGVSTIITNEVHNITGEFRATEEQTSNLADNILFLRHVEYRGEMRKVIGVLKMRTSDFERTLRELEITEHGLKVGEPLPDVRGILTGTPEFAGESTDFSSTDDF
ncbi:MAG: circadian clock protein KaiC [Natronomonas sp.]|jgi:circadian clock protein KaiC